MPDGSTSTSSSLGYLHHRCFSLSLALQDNKLRSILSSSFLFLCEIIENDDGVESSRSYEYFSHAPTGEEVRLASDLSETNSDSFNCYPPSLHGALVSSPDPPPLPFPYAPSPSSGKIIVTISQFCITLLIHKSSICEFFSNLCWNQIIVL